MREDGHASLRMEFDNIPENKIQTWKIGKYTAKNRENLKKKNEEMTINKPLIKTLQLKYFRQGIQYIPHLLQTTYIDYSLVL